MTEVFDAVSIDVLNRQDRPLLDLSADHGAIRARAGLLVLAHESVPLLVRTPLPVPDRSSIQS